MTEQGSGQEQGSGDTQDLQARFDALQAEHKATLEVKDRFEKRNGEYEEQLKEMDALRLSVAYRDYALQQYDAEAPKKMRFLQGLSITDGKVTGEVDSPPGMVFKVEATEPKPSAGPSKSAETTKPPEPAAIDAAQAYRKAHGLKELQV